MHRNIPTGLLIPLGVLLEENFFTRLQFDVHSWMFAHEFFIFSHFENRTFCSQIREEKRKDMSLLSGTKHVTHKMVFQVNYFAGLSKFFVLTDCNMNRLLTCGWISFSNKLVPYGLLRAAAHDRFFYESFAYKPFQLYWK